MNNGRNNNQPPGQVPDYRLQEIQQQMRQLQEENRRLRQTFDQATQRQMQQQQPQAPQPSPFAPEVDQALQAKFQSLMQPIVQQTQGYLGQLADRNDYLEFNQKYGYDTLSKYQDKIESLREQRKQMGQYISREDAYKHIYFEETNRKPQVKPEPPKAPQGPLFDPYTGQMIQAPQELEAAQPPTLEQPVDPNAPPQPQVPQQMLQPQQQAPQPQVQQPNQFVPQTQSEVPQLPPQGMNPMSAPAPQATGRLTGLDLEADNRNLDAWAQKYGDIPL